MPLLSLNRYGGSRVYCLSSRAPSAISFFFRQLRSKVSHRINVRKVVIRTCDLWASNWSARRNGESDLYNKFTNPDMIKQPQKKAVSAKMAKMTQKAWFSIISDFWGDLSRSFCIRRAMGQFGCPVARLAQTWPKTFGINGNGAILIFWLHVKKRTKRHIFSL